MLRLHAHAEEIVAAVLESDRRVMLAGPAGSGKSTLAAALGARLAGAGRDCWCIGADPGSPAFGVPGAVNLGHWRDGEFHVTRTEALCTLDAARFRLPLVAAVTRLVQSAGSGVLLLDAPGVTRGLGGAELLHALVQSAAIEELLFLVRDNARIPMRAELASLGLRIHRVQASSEAARPGKRARARARSALWEAYLADAEEHRLRLDDLHLIGSPPPADVGEVWAGRQVALLDAAGTRVMGEVIACSGRELRLRLPEAPGNTNTLLLRDATRGASGFLETAQPFVKDTLSYAATNAPGAVAGESGVHGPQVSGRIGIADLHLVNGVFGDPLLHLRLRHEKRSLLFDLGEGARLSARVAHQVTDVFISHAHMDHIAGFLWLLRSRIGAFPPCRVYGPPELARNIDGLCRGILWDWVKNAGPVFEVSELHDETIRRLRVRAGGPPPECLDETGAREGILHEEAAFRVRAVTLTHSSPVLAFAFEPKPELHVRKERLAARGLQPGPWLGELKRRRLAGKRETLLETPDGQHATVESLAEELILISPGKRLVYATDFADTPDNRERLTALARHAHTLFCEATFTNADAEQARRTAHLTTRACGEIAAAAEVARLVPFHFSRRYEDAPEVLYEEIAEVYERVARWC